MSRPHESPDCRCASCVAHDRPTEFYLAIDGNLDQVCERVEAMLAATMTPPDARVTGVSEDGKSVTIEATGWAPAITVPVRLFRGG